MAIYGNIAHKFVLNRIIFWVFFGSAVCSLLILSVLNRSAKKVQRSQSYDSHNQYYYQICLRIDNTNRPVGC
jgi:hypothetical protein